MSASHREIIRAAVADLGMAATNKQIRAWARRHHNIEIKNNEIINAVGSQRERTDHSRTAAQTASVVALVNHCDGSHDLALNLIRLDRTKRRSPHKEGKA